MRWHRGLVLVLLLSTSAGVSAQSSSLALIREISGLGPVPYVLVCKQAVNQDVEFSISTVLRGKPPNAIVKTSYVNCSSQPLLSPPFSLHATVIAYCEQMHVGAGTGA